MRKLIILLTFGILLNSCSPGIEYRMKDIPVAAENDLKSLSISIQISEDLRNLESPYKEFIFSEDYKNNSTCYNLEKQYDVDVSVPGEIERTISEHINAKQYFKNVYINMPDSADFNITMKLKSFVGKTEVNGTAHAAKMTRQLVGGIIGGLIGGLIERNQKSKLSYSIEYEQVIIHDEFKNSDIPQFSYSSVGSVEIPGVADCSIIYPYINSILKEHNEKFSKLLSDKLLEYLSEKETGISVNSRLQN